MTSTLERLLGWAVRKLDWCGKSLLQEFKIRLDHKIVILFNMETEITHISEGFEPCLENRILMDYVICVGEGNQSQQ